MHCCWYWAGTEILSELSLNAPSVLEVVDAILRYYGAGLLFGLREKRMHMGSGMTVHQGWHCLNYYSSQVSHRNVVYSRGMLVR